MKKLLLGALFLGLLSVNSFAAMGWGEIGNSKSAQANSTSGGLTITANMTGVTGKRIVIDSIFGLSDKSASQLLVQEAVTSGATYATKATLAQGAAQVTYGTSSIKPVYVASAPAYYLRVLQDSTTANSVLVNYHEE